MQIPVLQGRTFGEHDGKGSSPVVIVSLSAARRLWPGQNPVGKRLMASYDRPEGNWQTVVGVVGDARYRGLTETTFELYKPYLQSEDAVKHFIVQASENPSTFLGRLRSEIRSVDPNAVIDAIRPMREVVDRSWRRGGLPRCSSRCLRRSRWLWRRLDCTRCSTPSSRPHARDRHSNGAGRAATIGAMACDATSRGVLADRCCNWNPNGPVRDPAC
jgi:MacB-like protein